MLLIEGYCIESSRTVVSRSLLVLSMSRFQVRGSTTAQHVQYSTVQTPHDDESFHCRLGRAQGVPTKDAEGQALALGFTRAKNVGENVSRRQARAEHQKKYLLLIVTRISSPPPS